MRSLGEYSRLTLKTHNLYQRERTFWDYFSLKCSFKYSWNENFKITSFWH